MWWRWDACIADSVPISHEPVTQKTSLCKSTFSEGNVLFSSGQWLLLSGKPRFSWEHANLFWWCTQFSCGANVVQGNSCFGLANRNFPVKLFRLWPVCGATLVKALPLLIQRAGFWPGASKEQLVNASRCIFYQFQLEDTLNAGAQGLHGGDLGEWYNHSSEVVFVTDQGILF